MSTVISSDLYLPTLHAMQRQIHRERRRFNVVAGGRRWGKSVLGIDEAIDPALDGYPVAYYSPTHKMLTEVWREVCSLLAPIIERRNAQEPGIAPVVGQRRTDHGIPDRNEVRHHRRLVDHYALVPATS
jgi:hypothetical protein